MVASANKRRTSYSFPSRPRFLSPARLDTAARQDRIAAELAARGIELHNQTSPVVARSEMCVGHQKPVYPAAMRARDMDEVQSRTLECSQIDLYARIDVPLIDGTIKMNVEHWYPLTIFRRRLDGGELQFCPGVHCGRSGATWP
jgi:hypothetical protein